MSQTQSQLLCVGYFSLDLQFCSKPDGFFLVTDYFTIMINLGQNDAEMLFQHLLHSGWITNSVLAGSLTILLEVSNTKLVLTGFS